MTWSTVHLDEVYEFSSGLSKPRSEFGSGYPFLSFVDVFYNIFLPNQLSELVRSTDHERASRSIMRGDVFLTRTSETQDELGMSSVALKDYPGATFNGFTKRLRPKPGAKVVPEYAGYYFRSSKFRQEVNALSSLSTRASLNNEMLARLRIAIPPEDVQTAIGHILKAFDDKIDLNRQMNETLEEIARAIFKSWFVDFDPVRAKIEGRDTGLPKDLADLFPDSFEESELGEIPNGWGAHPLTDMVEIIGGGTPKTSVQEYWDGEIPWFSVVDAPATSEVWVVNTEKTITSAGVNNSSTKVLPVGTTIISARGTVGRVALVGTPMAMNQSCYGLRGLSGRKGLFNYFATRNLVATLQQRAHGSVFDTITRDTLAGVAMVSPPSRSVEAFEDAADPLLQRVRISLIQSKTLASIRDTLLPKLISGEIRIKDAQRVVEKVV